MFAIYPISCIIQKSIIIDQPTNHHAMAALYSRGERLLATMHELAQSRDGWVLKLGTVVTTVSWYHKPYRFPWSNFYDGYMSMVFFIFPWVRFDHVIGYCQNQYMAHPSQKLSSQHFRAISWYSYSK